MSNILRTYQLTLDFKKVASVSSILLHQYDKDSSQIIVTCTDNGSIFKVNSDEISAFIKWLKPDKLPVFNDCTVNDDGTITINCTEQMLSTDGNVEASLMFIDINSGDVLHTMPFKVVVKKSPFPNDTVTSSYEFDALNSAMGKIKEFVEFGDEIKEKSAQWEENEEKRIQNENERIEAETKRVDAESKRVNAETQREQDFGNIVNSIESITDEANDALNQVNEINTAANETIGKLNEAVSTLDNINPSIISVTQPTEQEIGGLWFVEVERA